jgi:hypothetical protein
MDKLTTRLKKIVDWIKKRQAQNEYDYPVEFIEHNEYNLINFSGSFAFWFCIMILFFGSAIFANWDKILQLVNLLK